MADGGNPLEKLKQNIAAVHEQLEADLKSKDPAAQAFYNFFKKELGNARESMGLPSIQTDEIAQNMTRYWLIAPFDSQDSSWSRVWDYGFKNHLITIGWHELGDLSSASDQERRIRIGQIFPDYPPGIVTWLTNTFGDFYSVIKPGDIVLARRGRKELVGVGTVTGKARYDASFPVGSGIPGFNHPNLLPVEWQKDFRARTFNEMVFGIQTMYGVTQQQYEEWLEPASPATSASVPFASETLEQAQEFVLERYLEDFIATNFARIFEGKLKLYSDPIEKVPAQQYTTDVGRIDLLAQSLEEKEFVVIELKKGMTSDEVVGQTLRYMGWVKSNLCKSDQGVSGIIISKDADHRLEYALKMVPAIQHMRYEIQFSLK